MGLGITCWFIWKSIETHGAYIHSRNVWIIVMYGSALLCQLLNYRLTKKFPSVSLWYCAIQTTLFLVLFFEMNIVTFPDKINTDLFTCMTIYAQSLSIVSYNQAGQVCVYMGLAIYQFFRHYFKYVHYGNG